MKLLHQKLLFILVSIIIAVNMIIIGYTVLYDPEIPTINNENTNNTSIEPSKKNETSKEYKVGEMMMISIPDKSLSKDTIEFLNNHKISGVILMGHNIENKDQVKKLTSQLRSNIDENILIATDQEGGTVARFHFGPHADKSQRYIGNNLSTSEAYDVAYERGIFLKEMGINMVFAPVADIGYEEDSFVYDRSFASDPSKTATYVAASIKGYKDAGIEPVLKHFPGHGGTSTDSHKELPLIDKSKNELLKSDFIPFESGIEAGADFIMMGHILNPQINPDTPSSLSQYYKNILKENYNFDGIIITDDLKMTGKIEGGISWGINLIIDDFKAIETRMEKIQIDEDFIDQVRMYKAK
jgi:beta-N-acetylhexosaminidase